MCDIIQLYLNLQILVDVFSNRIELLISFRFTAVIKSNVSNYEEYAELVGQKLVSTMGLEALIFLNNESSKKIDILYLSVVDIWYLVGLETADYL